jgi:hypothetical protein
MFTGLAQPRRLTATVAGVAAACALLATGCGTAASAGHPDPKVVVVRDSANGKTVSVGVGDTVKLILSSSYWNVSGSSAPRVLRPDGPAVLLARPKNCAPIPGLGCTPIRVVFTALARGKAVIRASRTSCGEALRCVGKRATRFTLTVVIKSAS